MKRGLKGSEINPFVIRKVVTTVTPMKRGLKGTMRRESVEAYSCYNRYPDEKGTESQCYLNILNVIVVTTVTPMKRGLKDHHRA